MNASRPAMNAPRHATLLLAASLSALTIPAAAHGGTLSPAPPQQVAAVTDAERGVELYRRGDHKGR